MATAEEEALGLKMNVGRDEMVSVEVPVPHPKNARRGNLDAIMASMRANGWFGKVILQERSADGTRGYIIVGEHRWRGWKGIGGRELPVTWLDVDDEEAQRIRTADNATNDLSEYDNEILAEVLHELLGTERGLDGTTFSPDDLTALAADLPEAARLRIFGPDDEDEDGGPPPDSDALPSAPGSNGAAGSGAVAASGNGAASVSGSAGGPPSSNGAASAEGGASGGGTNFPRFDENISTDHTCPKCGFRFSGGKGGK